MTAEKKPSPGMSKALKRMREDGPVADFTLAIGTKQWKVHGAVVYLHSNTLHTMGLKAHGKGDLKGWAHKCIDALVRFLYYQQYDLPPNTNNVGDRMDFHLQMNRIAQEYDIADLKSESADKFVSICKTFSYDARKVAAAIAEIYVEGEELVSSDMRTKVAKFLADKYSVFRLDTNPLTNLITEFPPLAIDIAKALAAEKQETNTKLAEYGTYKHCGSKFMAAFNCVHKGYACPNCGEKLSGKTWRVLLVKDEDSLTGPPLPLCNDLDEEDDFSDDY